MIPIFNNKQNTSFIFDDKEVWISRSTAVVAIVIGIYKRKKYVLIEKRSNSMPDSPGKWVVPGGYIDYNESGWDCFRRELYEESGLNIDLYKDNIIFDNDKQPFFVKTEPDENRQNIVLNYCTVIKFNNKNKIPFHVETFQNLEIDCVKWILINEINNIQYNWAFNHNLRIKMALTKYNSEKWKLKNILKRLRILIMLVK
jgi:8-oxo-dGTP pyrophosphatase MutT (NUDIX family)